LPICFGEATKFSRFLLESDKHYILQAKLGIRTDSGDSEGQMIAERIVPSLSLSDIEQVLAQFRGNIQQIPSMYSAIKHKGQPLYKLARQGLSVERTPRDITIYTLLLLSYENGILSLEVKASKGTYMRSLVDDIGELLGCGAHVIMLRRIAAGPYTADTMVEFHTLEQLEAQQGLEALDQDLLPVDTSVATWPDVTLSEAAAYYLRQGQPVIVPYAPTEGWVRLVLKDNRFLGVGEILDDGRVAPRRLLAGEAK
jgi:tRNA pseudouridine55 synthase